MFECLIYHPDFNTIFGIIHLKLLIYLFFKYRIYFGNSNAPTLLLLLLKKEAQWIFKLLITEPLKVCAEFPKRLKAVSVLIVHSCTICTRIKALKNKQPNKRWGKSNKKAFLNNSMNFVLNLEALAGHKAPGLAPL